MYQHIQYSCFILFYNGHIALNYTAHCVNSYFKYIILLLYTYIPDIHVHVHMNTYTNIYIYTHTHVAMCMHLQ